eukprot:5628441-Prymnesium_polylepis.2
MQRRGNLCDRSEAVAWWHRTSTGLGQPSQNLAQASSHTPHVATRSRWTSAVSLMLRSKLSLIHVQGHVVRSTGT